MEIYLLYGLPIKNRIIKKINIDLWNDPITITILKFGKRHQMSTSVIGKWARQKLDEPYLSIIASQYDIEENST